MITISACPLKTHVVPTVTDSQLQKCLAHQPTLVSNSPPPLFPQLSLLTPNKHISNHNPSTPGPGFDVLGISLSIWLELNVTFDRSVSSSSHPLNCKITYEGDGADHVPLDADKNLITRTALYVLRCHSQRAFPIETHVHVNNPIPLGRGLGSSGAAVVAGVILGNAVGELGLSKDRMMDYCLMIERHPDNVMAAMMGGFVGSYLKELDPVDMERREIPLAEVLPEPAGGEDTGLEPPKPPVGIGHFIKFGWAKEVKAIAIIPQFEVSTATARSVLPKQYSAKDMASCYAKEERRSIRS